MDITISIIIAIYNRKDELTELLTSLTQQTDNDFEVIIVDDGSIIDLYPVVSDFEGKLDIQYFKKSNSGPGLSRNYGAERAKNEWLVFVDSDVIVERDYIQNIKANISQTPTDAFGGADKAHQDFNWLQKAISYSMTSVFTTGGIRGNKNAVGRFQPRSFNMGVRKTAFQQVGGFSEMRIGEDPDLSMTLWERGFTTRFYDDIAVYHKRRATLGKFAKQVYQFGCARPILNQRHPQYTKITFWFPTLFMLGFFLAVGITLIFGFVWFFVFYGFYMLVIFLHSSWQTRNPFIGLLVEVTTFVQMLAYGWGFLKSWLKLNVLKQPPRQAFPKHFY